MNAALGLFILCALSFTAGHAIGRRNITGRSTIRAIREASRQQTRVISPKRLHDVRTLERELET